jgi:hypothetical protein
VDTEKTKKRPIAITILAWLYIAVGVLSTGAHYANFRSHKPMVNEFFWITALGAAAILAGAFMLHGHNWARWLALAWIAAHVVISALNLMHGLLMHCVVFLLVAAILFQREAREYFKTG